jgi:hypothetical protein
MAKLNIRPISRVTRDPANNALRSYYDPVGTEGKLGVAAETIGRQFLEDNLDHLRFDSVILKNLEKVQVKDASGFQSVQFMQHFQDVPVYGALVVVNVGRARGNILSCYNNYDYDIPEHFPNSPKISVKQAQEAVKKHLHRLEKEISGIKSEDVQITGNKLFIYRHHQLSGAGELVGAEGKRPVPAIDQILMKIPTKVPKEGKLYLVWQIFVQGSHTPLQSLELLVDAQTADILLVQNLCSYAQGLGRVFVPDPVTSSGSANLVTTTPGTTTVQGTITPTSTFNPLRQEVDLLGLDPADANGKYSLVGEYCVIKDWHTPTHAEPKEAADPIDQKPHFFYDTDNRDFLAVMAYYWIDTVRRFIKNDLNVSQTGLNALDRIEIDPQGVDQDDPNGYDNSETVPIGSGKSRIRYGEGGAPDASDAAVLLHEYGHAIHSAQGFTGDMALREGFSDLLARVFLDRFNSNQVLREEVFPWDNNPSASYHWSYKRRMDLTESYANTTPYTPGYFWGNIWATTFWQIYLALGGASVYPDKRRWAGNLALKLILEANIGYATISTAYTADFASHQRMAEALEMVSHALNNWQQIPDGLFHKVIRDRCINRGLFSPLDVDVYIDDGRAGGYEYLEWFWETPDIVVRRLQTDTPTQGYEEPIVNAPNYLWVKVKRKGSGDPGNVQVKVFSCTPGTGLIWPTHWTAASPASLPATTLATAQEEWVGPFEFTPTELAHSCVLAIAEADNDPANTENLIGSVPHWMLVPFDNNIAQRNLKPQKGEGKHALKFRLINSTGLSATAALAVEHDLPKGWRLEFDVPSLREIPLAPYGERWVTARVVVPPGLGFRSRTDHARVRVLSVLNGMPDGGMTFDFVHPSLFPPDQKPGGPAVISAACCDCLRQLLADAEVEGEIKIEIRFKKRT